MATLSQSLIAPISGITELAAEKTWYAVQIPAIEIACRPLWGTRPGSKWWDDDDDYDVDLCRVLAQDPGDEVYVMHRTVVEYPSTDLQVVQGR